MTMNYKTYPCTLRFFYTLQTMAALSSQLSASVSNVSNVSTSTSAFLTPPLSMTHDELDLDFPTTKRSFTGLIKQCFDNHLKDDDNNIRKRYRLTLQSYVSKCNIKKSTAYLLDEWAEVMEYFWNTSNKERDNTQISITFYGIRIEKIPESDIDPTQDKNIAFILDKDTPNDENVWIEFKSCCNRITGRNGIRLTKQDVINHLSTDHEFKLNIRNNGNANFLSPNYPYRPLSEFIQTKQGYIYGFVTNELSIKPCKGKHNFSKQIRIRDATLPWDSDDFQIMFFGDDVDQFPNVREGDLMRLHRINIQYRTEVSNFQGTFDLNKTFMTFIVIDGNLTIPNNNECVRHSSSQNYSFDELVDGYFVKYLKNACRIRQEKTNPDLLKLTQQQQDNIGEINIPNVMGINRNVFIYLNEIQSTHDRINLVVMIMARLDIDDDENDNNMDNDDEMDNDDDDAMDNMEFYWVIWDGSDCERNKDLIQLCDPEELKNNEENDKDDDAMDIDENDDDNKWNAETTYDKNQKIIGSKVKVLVSPEYETAVQCYNDIEVGTWVELSNIKVDHTKKQLIYDKNSKIYSKINWRNNTFVQQRHDMLYSKIDSNTNVITHISSINPQHQYQSWTPIKSIIKMKTKHCKHKIRGKCIGYYPSNIQKFTTKIEDNGAGSSNEMDIDPYYLRFVLWIQDASDAKISVIFEGKEAERFLGIEDPEDLTTSNNGDNEQLQEIGHCMEMIMNDSNLIDVCIRSYVPKHRNLILYKAFDTVLIQ